MFKKTARVLMLLMGLFSAGTQAQEGHPLVGTWQGEWSSGEDDNFLTVIMYWDGTQITGLVNPGPDSTTLTSAQLNSTDWTVRIETELKNATGATLHFIAEGVLDNVGSQTRALRGNWQSEGGNGTFTLTRQSGA